MFRTLSSLLVGLLAEDVPVNFVSVSPRSGETIAANAILTLIFDGVPFNLTSSAGKVTVSGRTAHIDGPFTPRSSRNYYHMGIR